MEQNLRKIRQLMACILVAVVCVSSTAVCEAAASKKEQVNDFLEKNHVVWTLVSETGSWYFYNGFDYKLFKRDLAVGNLTFSDNISYDLDSGTLMDKGYYVYGGVADYKKYEKAIKAKEKALFTGTDMDVRSTKGLFPVVEGKYILYNMADTGDYYWEGKVTNLKASGKNCTFKLAVYDNLACGKKKYKIISKCSHKRYVYDVSLEKSGNSFKIKNIKLVYHCKKENTKLSFYDCKNGSSW